MRALKKCPLNAGRTISKPVDSFDFYELTAVDNGEAQGMPVYFVMPSFAFPIENAFQSPQILFAGDRASGLAEPHKQSRA